MTAYTQIPYTGNGVTTQYAVNFPLGYLSKSDVTCRVNNEVDGLGNPTYRTLTWITDNLAQIGGAVPGVGEPILFERTVSKTTLKHDYQDGAPITESNLDESNKQNLMAIQEALDGRFSTLAKNLDMGGFKIINLSNPVAAQDAVTKAYADFLVINSGNVPAPTGADTNKVLTATGVGTWAWGTPSVIPSASESVEGTVEYGDDAEADAGSATNRVMSIAKTAARYARMAVANSFTAAQTITVNAATALSIVNSGTGSVGTSLVLRRSKAALADNDYGNSIEWVGKGDAGTDRTHNGIYTQVLESADAAVDSMFVLRTMRDGVAADLYINQGCLTAAGYADVGTGSINVNKICSNNVGVAGPLVRIEYQTTAGVASITTVATTWTDIPMNTIVQNDLAIGALSSGRFTLPAGRYRVKARQTFFLRNGRIRLQNITDGTTIQYGTFAGIGGTAQNLDSHLDGIDFIIASTKTLALQYYQTAAQAGGLGGLVTGGVPASNVEHWGYVELEKVE